MPWKTFDRRGSKRFCEEPTVTIRAAGAFGLNAAAFRALGEPLAVYLLFAADEGLIGFRRADPTDGAAYPVICQGSSYAVSGTAFLRRFAVPHAQARRHTAQLMDGDVLAIDPQHGIVAARHRKQAGTRSH